MLLDDNDHITWEGIHEYSNDEKVFSFLEHYGHTMPDHAQQFLAKVVATKHIYNDKQKEGLHYTIAAKVAVALTGIQAQAKGELGK